MANPDPARLDEMGPVLDRFIPEYDVRERHSIAIRAPARFVFEIARGYDMRSIGLVGAILSARAWVLGSSRPAAPRRGLVEETRSLGWGVLGEEAGRSYCSGAVCQPWLADVVFRSVPPAEFRGYHEPDAVKIAWTLEALPLGPERTRFSTETRVAATDASARRKFLRYWRFVRPGVLLIRVFLLRGVRGSAERAWLRARDADAI
jgi:hypothetical protein